MIRLVTFASDNMGISMQKCVESALIHGVDHYNDFRPQDISGEFFENNKATLVAERGAGFWLWKPYFINQAVHFMADDDVLIYADAGIEFVAGVRNIINRMDEDILFFTNGFLNMEWCKGDVLRAVLPGHEYNRVGLGWNPVDKQVQASVIFFKVNQKTRDFVKEWLLWCQMPGFIDDSPSKYTNYPTFAEHRHDQAILTCLQIKYGYKLHFWPTNYSEHIRHTAQPEDSYPTLFNHHRKRNSEW